MKKENGAFIDVSIPLKSGLIVIKISLEERELLKGLNPLEIGSNCNSYGIGMVIVYVILSQSP